MIVVVWALAAPAQESSFLESTLQDALSSQGNNVRVIGLVGALSSSATVREITFADAEGIWLSIQNAELEWTRTALLRGRVDIEKMTAQKIDFVRLPRSPDTLPSPEAQGFRLPELPVSVKIGELSAAEVSLGAEVLGQATVVNLAGSLSLADNKAVAEIAIERIDGENGILRFAGEFDGAAEKLKLDLKLEEAAEGIFVTMLDVPGHPSASLDLQSAGPLSDFRSDLVLMTDGSERLKGDVTIKHSPQSEEDGTLRTPSRAFALQIQGDIAPLFWPEYRAFFGDALSLMAQGNVADTQAFEINEFDLVSNAISLTGSASFGEDRFPEIVDLRGSIGNPEGTPVLLPLTGEKTYVKNALLALAFDTSESDVWTGSASLKEFARDGLRISDMTLQAIGDLLRRQGERSGGFRSVTADVTVAANEMQHSNADISRAIGANATASARVEWYDDTPLTISELQVASDGYEIALDGTVSGLDSAITVAGTAQAELPDLAIISGLLDLPLTGAASLELSGQAALLAGTFDMTITGEARNPRLGNPYLDPFLRGASQLNIHAIRGTGGLEVPSITFSNPQARGRASASIHTDASTGELDFTLHNAGLLSPNLTGPMRISGGLAQQGRNVNLDLKSVGSRGLTADLTGSVPLTGGDMALKISGVAPLALADVLLAKRSARVQGRARFDLTLNGPPRLSSISGKISTSGAQLVDPTQKLTLENISVLADVQAGQAQISGTMQIAGGGDISVAGQVALAPNEGYPSSLDFTIRDLLRAEPEIYKTSVSGELNLTGPLQTGGLVSGTLRLGPTEIRVQSTGLSYTGPPPDIIHLHESTGTRATRKRAGFIQQNANKLPPSRFDLDILVIADREIYVRGRGINAELGGRVRIRGTASNMRPEGQFNLIRGRMDLLGKRLNLTEGSVTLTGILDPDLYFVVEAQNDGITARIIIRGPISEPVFSFDSTPELPEGEILAAIFFNRNLDQLSPFQALALASGIAELTGRSGGNLIGRLRENLGLDDFSVQSDGEDGGASVTAGKYLSDELYTDVTVGGSAGAEISLNLDITDTITAKGTAGADGSSSIGIFFEKDY